MRLWDNHSTREAMQREFDILMSLHHENIVQALTSCYHGDSFWLFMELLEGGELLELVLREGAVAEARAVGYMVQILRGVAHMHSRGVVHRG